LPDVSQLFDEVKRLNISETIIQQVKQLILQGKLKAGQKLPSERLLAEQLGVGRSSVREATSALLALGIVEIRPGEGVFIRSDFPRSTIASVEWSSLILNGHAHDLIEARNAVESATARLAAQRATPPEHQQLHTLVEQMAQTGDVETFVDLDIKFHLTLAQASQNLVLRELLIGIQQLMRGAMRHALQATEVRRRAVEQHRRLAQIIAQGAAEEAEQTMRAHLTRNTAFFGQMQ
jgi:GntR family transcriptional regulator, transcriptional repressor for pyruvate dehydrogenase complex